jgi:hypothetical protein
MVDETTEYEQVMGHPPPEAPDDFSWQWRYKGSPSERERLLQELLQAEAEEEYEQMSLC